MRVLKRSWRSRSPTMVSVSEITPHDWRERARHWAQTELRPLVPEIDRTDRLPPEIFPAMAREGFTGLGTPERWQGSGGGSRAISAVLEELSRVSATVGTDLAVHLSVCAAPIRRWGTDAQKDRWLPLLAQATAVGAFALTEPGVGSDAAHLSTRYESDPTGFRLSGSKMFITNGATAGVVVAFATGHPGSGSHGISSFLVPRGAPGFSVAQRLDKLGLRGSETNELVFDGVRLPKDALLGVEGKGLTVALSALTGGRVGIGSCALGIAQAAYDLMEEEVRARPTDAGHARLARAYAELSAARAMVHEAARLQEAGAPFVTEASTAKLLASQVAVALAGEAVELIGPAATRVGHPAERLFRDARVFPIVEGTTEIQERILGRELLSPRSTSPG